MTAPLMLRNSTADLTFDQSSWQCQTDYASNLSLLGSGSVVRTYARNIVHTGWHKQHTQSISHIQTLSLSSFLHNASPHCYLIHRGSWCSQKRYDGICLKGSILLHQESKTWGLAYKKNFVKILKKTFYTFFLSNFLVRTLRIIFPMKT